MARDFTPKALDQFRAMWKRETGQEIGVETAREYAQSIVGLVDSVAEWKRARARDPPL